MVQDRGVMFLHDHRSTDWALAYVLIAALVAILWFVVRALARRRVHWAGLSIYVRTLMCRHPDCGSGRPRRPSSTWPSGCPRPSWCRGSSKRLVDALTEMDSSNITEVMRAPARPSLVSGLLVADRGGRTSRVRRGVRSHRRQTGAATGNPRTLIVWLCSHVFATLLVLATEGG